MENLWCTFFCCQWAWFLEQTLWNGPLLPLDVDSEPKYTWMPWKRPRVPSEIQFPQSSGRARCRLVYERDEKIWININTCKIRCSSSLDYIRNAIFVLHVIGRLWNFEQDKVLSKPAPCRRRSAAVLVLVALWSCWSSPTRSETSQTSVTWYDLSKPPLSVTAVIILEVLL